VCVRVDAEKMLTASNKRKGRLQIFQINFRAANYEWSVVSGCKTKNFSSHLTFNRPLVLSLLLHWQTHSHTPTLVCIQILIPLDPIYWQVSKFNNNFLLSSSQTKSDKNFYGCVRTSYSTTLAKCWGKKIWICVVEKIGEIKIKINSEFSFFTHLKVFYM
jgi:hypothetical protein